MSCGCKGAAPVSRTDANARAVAAGSSQTYEVVKANGTSTGRRFTSLVAASGYASRIGGTTRPV